MRLGARQMWTLLHENKGLIRRDFWCAKNTCKSGTLIRVVATRFRLGRFRHAQPNATLTGAHARDVETAIAPCGHLALFVGQDTLKNIWPRIAYWLSGRSSHERKSRSATMGSPSVEFLP
jgi:hypothetical protein